MKNISSIYQDILFYLHLLIMNIWDTDLNKSDDFLLNPSFCIFFVYEVNGMTFVQMLLYKNEIKV